MRKYKSIVILAVILLATASSAFATMPRTPTPVDNSELKEVLARRKKPEPPKPAEQTPAPVVQQPEPVQAPIPVAGSNIVNLVNKVRADHNLAPLEERSNLNASASLSVQNMIRIGTCCSHGNWQQWFSQAGASYGVIGENIGSCAITDEQMVAVWVSSPPHLENILDPGYKYAGVGKAVGTFTGDYSGGQPMQCIYYANHFGG